MNMQLHREMEHKSQAAHVIRFESIDSTHLEAKRFLERELPTGSVVIVAGTQTGGVGRFGRAWKSPSGGLWVNLIQPLGAANESSTVARITGLGLRLGVACLDVIDRLCQTRGITAELKWPNDILIHRRKVAGILTEVVTRGETNGRRAFAVTGVGVNGNFDSSALPNPLREQATTLMEAMGAPIDLEQLLSSLVDSLRTAALVTGTPPDVLSAATKRLHGRGGGVRIQLSDGSSLKGTLRGLDDAGHPVVVDAQGTRVSGSIQSIKAL